jgi:hypothetical protein
MVRISWTWWDDDDVCFVLDQHAQLDFYSASSLKQHSVGRHIAPLGHINLIQSQPVFALTPWYILTLSQFFNTVCLAENKLSGLAQPRIETTIFRTECESTDLSITPTSPLYALKMLPLKVVELLLCDQNRQPYVMDSILDLLSDFL